MGTKWYDQESKNLGHLWFATEALEDDIPKGNKNTDHKWATK